MFEILLFDVFDEGLFAIGKLKFMLMYISAFVIGRRFVTIPLVIAVIKVFMFPALIFAEICFLFLLFYAI